MLTLCGLFASESKSGTKYMSGSLGFARVMVFKNTKKKGDKSPDYFLCLAPKKEGK
jgi:hypothetical protein